MIALQVIWKHLYSTKSATGAALLYLTILETELTEHL